MCTSLLSPAKHIVRELFAVVAVIASATGCANNLHVEYVSDPPGAWISTTSGHKYGQCPFTVIYDVSKEDREKGYVHTPKIDWLWLDCQKSRSNPITFELKRGYYWTVTQKIPRESTTASEYGQLYSEYRKAVDIGSDAAARMKFKADYNLASATGGGRAGYMNWGPDLAQALSAGRTSDALKRHLRAFEAQHQGSCADWPTLNEK